MTVKNKISNKKVLVTGGAGFIGSNICDTLLSQNNVVVCLDNFITGKKENVSHLFDYDNFKLVEGDIRNLADCKKAVDGVEIVLHQAALGSIPRSIKDPLTTNAVNVNGFINILMSAKDAGVKRIVYASSSSVYGDSTVLPKTENVIGEPISPYAITKRVNELYAKVFAEIYSLEIIGLRYFNVYGMRQDPYSTYAAAIPKFINAILNHEAPVINGDGTYSRDFTFVEDVVQVNQLAALTDNSLAINQIYNVAAGERNTINTLFEILKKNLVSFNNDLNSVFPVYGPVRQGDVPHSHASIDKAGNLLGYNPKYSFNEGLKKTVEWYVENINPK